MSENELSSETKLASLVNYEQQLPYIDSNGAIIKIKKVPKINSFEVTFVVPRHIESMQKVPSMSDLSEDNSNGE